MQQVRVERRGGKWTIIRMISAEKGRNHHVEVAAVLVTIWQLIFKSTSWERPSQLFWYWLIAAVASWSWNPEFASMQQTTVRTERKILETFSGMFLMFTIGLLCRMAWLSGRAQRHLTHPDGILFLCKVTNSPSNESSDSERCVVYCGPYLKLWSWWRVLDGYGGVQ